MKAARYYGNRDVRVDDIDEPTPEAGEVLVDVAACGICGSDVSEYAHGPKEYAEGGLPVTLGHEIGGTVTDTGPGVDVPVGTDVVLNPVVACGDCYFCHEAKYHLCEDMNFIGAHRQGGYAERLTAPAGNAIPLPDGLSPEVAAVAQPMTVSLHAVMTSPLEAGQSVAVIGLGPIGLGIVQLARALGAGTVYASGHRPARRALAEECGADVVVDPRETDPVERFAEDTYGGVDVAFEVAGSQSSFTDAVRSTKTSGHVTMLGVFDDTIEMDPMDFVNHERSMNASAGYRAGPHADRDFGTIVDLIASGRLDPEPLITGRIDLEDIVEEGLEVLDEGESGNVKVLVRP